MKLTKPELAKVCKEYDLGKVKSIKTITTGWVNFNFDLKTDNGRYIIQLLGVELNSWKKHRLKLQFAVLKHLRERKFPYEIPIPLLNSKKKEILKLGEKNIWVYERIEGEMPEGKINLRKYREVAKALALFHKYTEDFKAEGLDEDREVEILFERYGRMSKVKPMNDADRAMLKSIDFFRMTLKKVRKSHCNNQRILHEDLSERNALFKGDKLVGIIDFDNASMRPVERDIILSIHRCDYKKRGISKQKIQIFLKQYRKFYKFSKGREKNFLRMLVRNNCSVFWWFYEGMKKNLDGRAKLIGWITKETKKFEKKLK